MTNQLLIVRPLGLRDYEATVAAMQDFTEARGPDTPDELWLLEHPPVFTLGRAARAHHVRAPGGIPVVRTDRGGQVTYHGPGQLVGYVLVDLTRRGLGIKHFVRLLEDAMIEVLAGYGVDATRRVGAPGVYAGDKKIAALGLRVRRGSTYHGFSLNVAMDVEPFDRIDPCGYPGLEVAQLADIAGCAALTPDLVGAALAPVLARRIGYNGIQPAPADAFAAPASSLPLQAAYR